MLQFSNLTFLDEAVKVDVVDDLRLNRTLHLVLELRQEEAFLCLHLRIQCMVIFLVHHSDLRWAWLPRDLAVVVVLAGFLPLGIHHRLDLGLRLAFRLRLEQSCAHVVGITHGRCRAHLIFSWGLH